MNNVKKAIVLMVVVGLLMSNCASNRTHKHKKLKPGKPIPCPLKDC
jgi:uncharacterized protein YceK